MAQAGGMYTPATYGTDSPEVSSQEFMNQQQQAGSNYRAQLAMQAQEYPAQLQQQRFNSVFPWVQSTLSNWLTGMKNPYTIGGNSGNGPAISAAPVWNPQQIQQQVNQSNANTDTSTATANRTMQQGMGGRGFGSNSPLAQALGAYNQAQGLSTKTSAAQGINWNAAQGNAQQQLAGQQAQENQYHNRMEEGIQRAQPYFQTMNTLIGALGGLV